MPLRIDSIEKLESAYRVMQSGQGTEEQRDEIQRELQRLAPVIRMGMSKHVDNFGMKISQLDTTDANLYAAIAAKRHNNENAGMVANAVTGVTAGPAQAVTGVGEAITDLLGWNALATSLGERKENIAQGAVTLNQDLRKWIMGRELSDKEKESATEDALTAMRVGELATEVGAGFATGAATVGAKGILSGLSLGAAEGGIFAYLTADTEGDTRAERINERLGQAKWGALLGGGVGTLTGGAAAVRNLLVHQVRRYSGDIDEARRLSETFGVRLDIGQATGSPTLQAATAAAGADFAQTFYRNQADGLAQAISNKIGFFLPKLKSEIGANLTGKTQEAFSAFDEVVSSIKARGQGIWQKAVQEAGKRVNSADDIIMKDVNHLQGHIQNIAEQLDTRFGGTVSMGENLENLFRQVQVAAGRGGASLDDINRWWLQINAMADEPVKAGFVRFARGVPDNSTEQLDTLAGTLRRGLHRQLENAPSNPALDVLKAGREGWSSNQKALQDVTESVMERLGLGAKATPQKILQSLGDVDVNQLRSALNRIRKLPGGAARIRQIRSSMFEGIVEESMEAALGRAGQGGSLNVAKFQELMGKTAHRSRLAGLLTREQEKLAVDAVTLAGKILNAGAAKNGQVMHKIVAGAENWAINLVSRDPGFMARLLAGAASRGRGADWLFFTKDGQKVLQSLLPHFAKFPKMAGARNAGIAMLTGFLKDGAANAQEDRVRAQMGQ